MASAGHTHSSGGGYHGGVGAIISVEEVTRQALEIAREVSVEQLDALAENKPHLRIDGLNAGYGQMEILHDFNLRVGRGQSLCLIGPNGAGKSTVLHSIFGFTNIFSGTVSTTSDGLSLDVTRLSSNEKLRSAGIAYILQDKSVFPGMTVEENLWLGAYLMDRKSARHAADAIFDKYPRLAAHSLRASRRIPDPLPIPCHSPASSPSSSASSPSIGSSRELSSYRKPSKPFAIRGNTAKAPVSLCSPSPPSSSSSPSDCTGGRTCSDESSPRAPCRKCNWVD